MINKYNGFIFDLDGTIYLDDKLIPKADITINKIKELSKKIVFISNKTTGSVHDYYRFLKEKGINVLENEIINSTLIIKEYLKKNYLGKNFFAIGEKIFINEIQQIGLNFCERANNIDIVLITLDRTLNYKKLEIAAKALDNGAKFYAANIDNTCPVVGGEILDAGAIISALEKRTNRKLEKHFGKPSKDMLDTALAILNEKPENCLIIGDRIETDIAMGNLFGIDTALVLTGVIKNYLSNEGFSPTYKIKSVSDLIK